MNAVDVVQEVMEITVDSGAATCVRPIRMKGGARTKATKTAANGIPRHVEGDARLDSCRKARRAT